MVVISYCEYKLYTSYNRNSTYGLVKEHCLYEGKNYVYKSNFSMLLMFVKYTQQGERQNGKNCFSIINNLFQGIINISLHLFNFYNKLMIYVQNK